MMNALPKPPANLEPRGRALWTATYERHPEMTELEREVLLEACRVVDRLEHLDEACRTEPTVMEGRQGPLINPALAEARQQANLLKMLMAAMRVPDEKTGKRPQVRGTARGAINQSSPAVTSIRDRLRSA